VILVGADAPLASMTFGAGSPGQSAERAVADA
jgi:hypothetical protein